jgi:cysteine desulfuration protein SufE
MTQIPDKLQELLDDLAFITDRTERAELLIETADRFDEVRVPAAISTRPHPEENHVTFCESDAYVWAVERGDGTLDYYFDVQNPQGLSAMAMAVILGEAYSGQPLEYAADLNTDLVFKIFGKEISMGKGQGLMVIVAMVRYEAQKRLKG